MVNMQVRVRSVEAVIVSEFGLGIVVEDTGAVNATAAEM